MEHEQNSAQGLAKGRRRKLRAGAKHKGQMRSPVRLVLAEWTICVTNVPLRLLSVEKALILAGTRWQIELLFNLRKQQVQIDKWRSYKAWAILCEVLAKLMAMVFQHWLLLLGWWQFLDRSLVKASQVMRTFAPLLTFALGGLASLSAVLERLPAILQACRSRMNPRKSHPNTYQQLLALAPVLATWYICSGEATARVIERAFSRWVVYATGMFLRAKGDCREYVWERPPSMPQQKQGPGP